MTKKLFQVLSMEDFEDEEAPDTTQDEEQDSINDFVTTKSDDNDNIAGTEREVEVVYYVRILDFKQFSKAASSEKHEQWMIRLPRTDETAASGSLRVREITDAEGHVSHNVSVKTDAKLGKFETTTSCSKEFFTQVAFLAPSGMIKHRYTFPIKGTDMSWEVDLYPDGKAGYYTWARVELELKGRDQSIPTLPLDVEEIITPEDQKSEETQKRIWQLFEDYFLTKNKYLAQIGEVDNTPKDKDEEESDDSDDTTDDTDSTNEESSNDSDSSDTTNTGEDTKDESSDDEKEDESKEEQKSRDKEN